MPNASAPKADARGSRYSEALLRADDVHDALSLVRHPKVWQVELLHVLLQGLDLLPTLVVLDKLLDRGELFAREGGHVVVDGHERAVGATHRPVGHREALEGLRRRHLVHKVAVDVDQGLAVRFPCDDVVIPDLVVKCARPGRGDVDRLALGRQPSRAARRYWKAAYSEAAESTHR